MWNNEQHGNARGLARLDRFYTLNSEGLDFHLKEYFIHGYDVAFDHSPVQVEIVMGKEGIRMTPSKWNTSHLIEDCIRELKTRWDQLHDEAFFFFKLRHITRLFRQHSKRQTRDNKRLELDIKTKLEVASA